MSLFELFLSAYPYICLVLINLSILAVLLPNRVINTSSTSSNLAIVGFIVAGLAGLRAGEYSLPLSLLLLSVVLISCCMHWIKVRQVNEKKQQNDQHIAILKRIK